jgi:iron complex transport system ATP-binding protein
MQEAGLCVQGVTAFRQRRAVLPDPLSLAVRPGDFIALIGPNGAGKSTLLHILAGLHPPTSGRVLMNGEALADLPPHLRARAIGFLPQGSSCHWSLCVRDVVALGRLPWQGRFARLSAADEGAVQAAMQALDLLALADRSVVALSGGEQARVFLARLLAGEPRFILADEPTANLDPRHQWALMRELAQRTNDGQVGTVVVLHDLVLAARFCRQFWLIDETGCLVMQADLQALIVSGALEHVYGLPIQALLPSAGACAGPTRAG